MKVRETRTASREASMGERDASSPVPEISNPDVLEWSVRLVTKRPRRAAVMTLFIIAVWVGLYLAYREPWWVIFAVLLLGGSVFFPLLTATGYRFDEHGISVKRPFYTVKKEWSTYRSYYPDPNGVLLSPFSTPSRLENFRGIYLRFGDNRREVLAYLEGIYPREETSGGGEGVDELAVDQVGVDHSAG
jgi:hypothetical protein